MEDHKKDETTTAPQPQSLPRGNFMDIQAPGPRPSASSAPVASPSPADTSTVIKPKDDDPGVTPVAIEATEPVETSVAQTPAEAPEAPDSPSTGLRPELLAQAQEETNKSEHDKKELLAAHASHKSHGPKLVIVIAVVIALALSGIAVYAYLQTQKDTKSDKATDTTQHESERTVAPATSTDAENAAKEMDETIKATDEAQEIPESGISEQSLGL